MSDISISLSKKIEELNSVIFQAQDKLKRLRKVYTKFSDLQVHHDRRGVEKYYSKKANIITDNVSIGLDYNQIRLIVNPFTICEGINIYSDPIEFYVADHGNFWHRYEFHSNWEQDLSTNNVSPVVIGLVKVYEKQFNISKVNE